MQSQKISTLPKQKGLKYPGVGERGVGVLGSWGFWKTKNVKKGMKLNWNFQRGQELEKIPSMGEV